MIATNTMSLGETKRKKVATTVANPPIRLVAKQMYARKLGASNFKSSELGCVVCQTNYKTILEYRRHLRCSHMEYRTTCATLEERFDFQFELEFVPGIASNVCHFVVTNIAERYVDLGHIYIVNQTNATPISFGLQTLQAGEEHVFQLESHAVDHQSLNTVILQAFKNGIEYIEFHALKKCCGIPEIMNKRKVPKIDQCLLTKSLLAGPAEMIESQFRSLKSSHHRLDHNNYSNTFSKLSMVERVTNQMELDEYRQEDVCVTSTICKRIKVCVPSVQDKMSRLTTYDTVHLTQKCKPKLLISGDVDELLENHILIKLHPKQQHPDSKQKYDMDFILGAHVYDVENDSLQVLHGHNLVQYLFPDTASVNVLPEHQSNLKWFNSDIKNNEPQMQAVRHIVAGTAYPSPYLLFGPPGTGKTKTLVEAISQIHSMSERNRILVCATSNAAADELALRIVQNLPNKCRSDHHLYRIYASSYLPEYPIAPELRRSSNFDLKFCPNWDFLKKFRIIVGTLVTGGSLRYANIVPSEFTHLFIDECGSSTEIASLVPIALCSSTKAIHAQITLAGDPKQLGPVVLSRHAEEMGYGLSLLERLMQLDVYKRNPKTKTYNPNVLTKLTQNYRSHPAIIRPSNRLFYDGELQACGSDVKTKCFLGWKYLPSPDTPIIFHAAIRQSQRDNGSSSIFNMHEVNVVISYVTLIMKEKINGKNVRETDIGIISPYRKQCFKLQTTLRERGFNNIMVATVEKFQGKEKPIIIASTARCQVGGIGFLKNPKRLNVMLTRAQCLMVIVGDPNTLKLNKNWRNVLIDFKAAGVCTGCTFNTDKKKRNRKTKTHTSGSVASLKMKELQIGDSAAARNTANHVNPFGFATKIYTSTSMAGPLTSSKQTPINVSTTVRTAKQPMGRPCDPSNPKKVPISVATIPKKTPIEVTFKNTANTPAEIGPSHPTITIPPTPPVSKVAPEPLPKQPKINAWLAHHVDNKLDLLEDRIRRINSIFADGYDTDANTDMSSSSSGCQTPSSYRSIDDLAEATVNEIINGLIDDMIEQLHHVDPKTNCVSRPSVMGREHKTIFKHDADVKAF